uniref:Ubiquitin-like domain-containing protein n=1 Tax=Panagrolaimus davidi TaxID=227884 RepID=A0A914QH87_9BILA
MMDIIEDPIFVIMNNGGNIIRVQVHKTYTFKKLQTRIQNDCGIPLKLQCFTCEDERNYSDMDNEEGEEAANNTLPTEDATNMVTTSVTEVNSPVHVQINDSGCQDMINGGVEKRTPCTYFATYITLKCINGRATAIFVKENETIEAIMHKIQERSGVSLDHQEFTCFDKRTLEEKFWEEEYKRFIAVIKSEDNMVQSFQKLYISNVSRVESDLTPTEDDESAVNISPMRSAAIPTNSSNDVDFDIVEYIKNEKLDKKLLVFTSNERKKCYEFMFVRSPSVFRCIKCLAQKKRTDIKVTIHKDSSKTYNFNTVEHVCEPIEYLSKDNEPSLIVKSPNFKFIKINSKGETVPLLIVFKSDDKSHCYRFEFDAFQKFYICIGCKKYRRMITARFIEHEGNTALELNHLQHLCHPQNYIS